MNKFVTKNSHTFKESKNNVQSFNYCYLSSWTFVTQIPKGPINNQGFQTNVKLTETKVQDTHTNEPFELDQPNFHCI